MDTNLQHATVVVQLPQNVVAHLVDSLQEIRAGLTALAERSASAAATHPTAAPMARIPLTAFRDNPQVAALYQLSYERVMALSQQRLLRVYADKGRTRYRWTTHEDIMAYIEGIRHEGMVSPKCRHHTATSATA